MNEQLKTPESRENQAWAAHEAAMDEQDRIWKEIEAVFASTPDRAEAEKIVLEKYAQRYDEALKKSTAAWEVYRDLCEQSMQTYKEEAQAFEKK